MMSTRPFEHMTDITSRNCNHRSGPGDTKAPSTIQNAKIWALHGGANPKVLLGSSAFNYGMGTHLVARVDGMPLTGDMVNAMADFCRFHLGPHFEKCAAAASSSEDQKNSSSTPPSPAEL
jgi:hypothetical protein